MADSFAILPNETLDNTLRYCSAEDLAGLRWVSKALWDAVRRLQFQKLTLLPTQESATKVAKIIDSKLLRTHVREFCFAALTSVESLDLDASLGGSDALSAQDLNNLLRVKLLDSLYVLRCHHDEGPGAGFLQDDLVDKFDTFRGKILTNLFAGLADRGDNSRKLETLDVVNLPCRSQPDWTNDENLSALLKTLKTLLLRFDYDWANDRPYGGSPRGDEPHEFFTRLPRTWLVPAAPSLTSLALGASKLWGYILKVDFRRVHFPRLKSLAMHNFVFSHDWQLKWILSHTSLETLCLFRCQILMDAIWSGGIDDEGYPTTLLEYGMHPPQGYYTVRSWHEYYSRFSAVLEDLKWFTTMPNDGKVITNIIGVYGRFEKYEWVEVIPEAGTRARDEQAFNHLMGNTARP